MRYGHNVYSLSRMGGKNLKALLGVPDQLDGIEKVSGCTRSMEKGTDALKARYKAELQPFEDKRAHLSFAKTKRSELGAQLILINGLRNISKDFEKASSEKGRSTDAPKNPSRDTPARQRTRRRDLE